MIVALDADVPLLFAGSHAPAVCMELKSIGLPHDRTVHFSRALCETVGQAPGVSRNRIYIEFSPAELRLWGWNGGTF